MFGIGRVAGIRRDGSVGVRSVAPLAVPSSLAEEAGAVFAYTEQPTTAFRPVFETYRRLFVEAMALDEGTRPLGTAETARAVADTLALLELLFAPLDGEGDGIIGEELNAWVNDVLPAPRPYEVDTLKDMELPWEQDPQVYFSCLLTSTLRGNLSLALFLLDLAKKHSNAYVSTAVSHVCDVLVHVPRSTAFPSEQAFFNALRRWRLAVTDVLRLVNDLLTPTGGAAVITGDPAQDWAAQLHILLGIIAGDPKALDAVRATCDWREFLAAYTLWIVPNTRRSSLPDLFDALDLVLPQRTLPSNAPAFAYEHIQFLALAGSLVALYEEALPAADNVWFAAHVADLLIKIGCFHDAPRPAHTAVVQIRDDLVSRYATLLISSTLWQLSSIYFSSCSRRLDRDVLRALLPRVPFDIHEPLQVAPDEPATAVLTPTVASLARLCRANAYLDEERQILRVFAAALARAPDADLSRALLAALLADNDALVTSTCTRILDLFGAGHIHAFSAVVDSLNESPIVQSIFDAILHPDSPPLPAPLRLLTFLVELNNFVSLDNDEDAWATLDLIVRHDLAPAHCIMPLLGLVQQRIRTAPVPGHLFTPVLLLLNRAPAPVPDLRRALMYSLADYNQAQASYQDVSA